MEELALVMSCHVREHRRNDICVFQHNILKYTFGHISCIGRPLLGDVGEAVMIDNTEKYDASALLFTIARNKSRFWNLHLQTNIAENTPRKSHNLSASD